MGVVDWTYFVTFKTKRPFACNPSFLGVVGYSYFVKLNKGLLNQTLSGCYPKLLTQERCESVRTIFHIEGENDYLSVASVYKWMDNYLFYTSTKYGKEACINHNLKFRYIRDARVMAWEMARWKPKVYVDVPFTPVTFPRNGEISVFLPNSLEPILSKKMLLYSYVCCPSQSYADILKSELNVSEDSLKVIGYPQLETWDEIANTKHKIPVLEASILQSVRENEEQSLVFKPDGNAGLRVATFLHQIGIGNTNFQMSLSSEPNLYKFLQKREKRF